MEPQNLKELFGIWSRLWSDVGASSPLGSSITMVLVHGGCRGASSASRLGVRRRRPLARRMERSPRFPSSTGGCWTSRLCSASCCSYALGGVPRAAIINVRLPLGVLDTPPASTPRGVACEEGFVFEQKARGKADSTTEDIATRGVFPLFDWACGRPAAAAANT